MRVYKKKNDVYMVQLPENRRFFQYLQSDSSLLGGNVIAIFSKKYGKDETPDINDVVSDSVEYICHTVINHGVELGLWTKYGNVQTNVQLDNSISSNRKAGNCNKTKYSLLQHISG